MIHANITTSSVFVSASGEWKLFGFELLTPSKDTTELPSMFSMHSSAYSTAAPELKAGGELSTAIDAWMYGKFVCQVLSNLPQVTNIITYLVEPCSTGK